jgi:hypothetical protein
MIEFQHDGIAFAAVNTRMGLKIVEQLIVNIIGGKFSSLGRFLDIIGDIILVVDFNP